MASTHLACQPGSYSFKYFSTKSLEGARDAERDLSPILNSITCNQFYTHFLNKGFFCDSHLRLSKFSMATHSNQKVIRGYMLQKISHFLNLLIFFVLFIFSLFLRTRSFFSQSRHRCFAGCQFLWVPNAVICCQPDQLPSWPDDARGPSARGSPGVHQQSIQHPLG